VWPHQDHGNYESHSQHGQPFPSRESLERTEEETSEVEKKSEGTECFDCESPHRCAASPCRVRRPWLCLAHSIQRQPEVCATGEGEKERERKEGKKM
jgi:hypothetical protein